MTKYICNMCGYVYDETLGDSEHGLEPGTTWENVSDDWECPLCQIKKSETSVWEMI